MYSRLAPLTLAALMLTSVQAFAVCSSPAGDEGEIVYNSTYKIPQYCDGTDWVAWGSGYSSGGSSGSTPSGAVMAFNLSSCPTGWSEYTLARGRFIRGIDSTGTNDPDGVRALGNAQEDALQNITGAITSGPNTAMIYASSGAFYNSDTNRSYLPNGGTSTGWPNAVNFDASLVARTSTETRPKNVALLYCEKD